MRRTMTRWWQRWCQEWCQSFGQRIASADARLLRVITALSLLMLVLVLLLFADLVLLPATIVVLGLTAREWAHLAPREDERDARGLVCGLVIVLSAYAVLGVGCLLLLLLFLPVALLLSREGQQHNLLGLFCLAVLGVGFVDIHERFGVENLGWLILVVSAFDIGALFGGKALRGPKLWQRVSPDKRWTGLLCGLLAAGFLGTLWWIAFAPASSRVFAVLASLSVAAGVQLGDLAESQLKRRVGVKDAGALLPGHGGVLDRIDGMLCAVPIAWVALDLFEKI